MKKILLLVSLTLGFLSFVSAQVECAHSDIKNYLQANDSTFNQRYHQYMINSVAASKTIPKGEIKELYTKRSTAPNFTHYIIPVVVHVVHNNGVENISDAQIFHQIDSLNHAFKPYNIQFCLAKMKPDSTSFNGITRIQNSLTDYRVNLDNNALMDLDVFPRDKYLNIWIVKSIKNDDGSPSNRVGSAYSPLGEKLGIAIRYDFFGNYTTCGSCNLNSASLGKVLVHEMGHFLGLEHTHNGAHCGGDSLSNCNTQGDYICDTPPMELISSQCSTSNTCSEYPSYREANDPIHNYMSYKTETCLKEFTPEQVQLMHWQIETYLAPLIDIDNLNYVLKQGCGQISALFKPSIYTACQTTTITLRTLKKYNDCQFQWQIKNTSNGQTFTSNPNSDSFYNFSFTPGFYDITLVVFSGNFSISRTIKQLITVQNCGNTIASPRGNWYFGEYAGLEFRQFASLSNIESYRGGTQNKTKSNLNSLEGCIVQNNKAGGLLFYGGGKIEGNSDSFYVYDKRHQKMPNGGVIGASSSAQGGIVVPMPGYGNKYYLFTTTIQKRTNSFELENHYYYGLRYSVIDTALNGGNGDVIPNTKNTPVYPPQNRMGTKLDSAIISGEGIAAIPGCDTTNYYLILTSRGVTYNWFENQQRYDVVNDSLISKSIEIYKVDANGISHHAQYWHTDYFHSYGAIIASPDGSMVSVCGLLFEFDRFTGTLKFIKNLQDQPLNETSKDFYHSRFSPNGNLLYILRHIPLGNDTYRKELRQYDLSKGDWLPIISNLKSNAYSLQNGPDGKMYVSQFQDNYISVINQPNAINDFQNNNKIQYQQDKINLRIGLADMKSMGGLPNFIDAAPQKDIPIQVFHRAENCNSFYFYTNQCCKTNYVWDFGDGDTAHGKTAIHSYSGKTGTYYVTLTLDGSITLYDTIQFGFSGTAIGGLTTTCDTITPSYFYVNKPKTNLYQYNWAVTNGTYTSKFPRTGAEVKWTSDNGTITLFATDKYGCKDTANMQFQFANLINNNVITAIGDCSAISISSSTPTGGNGTFQYFWRVSLNGRDYTTLTNENNINYQPPISNVTKYYQRIVRSNGCENFSNIVSASTFQNDNVIREYNMPNDPDKCDTRLKGTNIKINYPTATVVWQKSTDSITWTSFTPASDTFTSAVEQNQPIVFYRRVCSLDTCVSYSNVIKYTGSVPLATDLVFCKNFEFPFTINFTKPSTGNYSSSFIYRRQSNWYSYNNANFSTNSVVIEQHPDISQRIKRGDTMRIIFQKIGCYQSFNDLSTPDIIPTYMDTFFFITQPQNQTVNAGDFAQFFVKVNKPDFCTFTWQYSNNGGSTWQPVNNSNNDTLNIQYTSACYYETLYRCKIQSACSTTYSNSVTLTINNLSSPTFDYWMKNTEEFDLGIEPDTFSNSFAKSTDIWLRHNKDSIKEHQDLNTEANICYVYVTVRNKGTNPTQTAKLFTYWTWGATNESWELNWTKNNFNRTFLNGMYSPMGGEINKIGINIPEIAAGSSVNIAIPWSDFPKKGWYDLNSQKWEKQRINICLLARIQTCDVAPFGMTNFERTDVFYNIKHNNNIVSRNTYTLPLKPLPPYDGDNGGNNGEVYRSINPFIIDGGTIAVRNNDEEARKSTICIKTIDVAYFDKAETYIEIGEALKTAIEWSPSVVYSGLTHVVDNIYQVSSANACFEDVVLPAHFQDAVLPLFAYKDINDRFPDGASFSAHIQQKDSLGYLVGECVFTLTDNLFVNPEPTYIEDDTALYICNSTNLDPEILTAEYVYPASFPYVVLDDNNDTLTQTFNHTYNLNQGTYTFVATDSSSNTKYFTSVLVEVNNLNESFVTDTLPFNCELGYYGLNIYDNQTLVYDENDDLVTETSTNYYELDAVNHQYKTIYTNLETCESEETTLHFDDDFFLPSEPSAFIYGDFNSETDTCAFVKTNEVTCMGQSIELNQTIDVLDINGLHLLTTTIINHETRGNGFYFCPPYWNNEPEHIYDWYSLVFRTDFCEYCRLDFRYDSTGIYERSSSLTNATLIKNRVMLYPNPANQDVNIHILGAAETGLETITIQILDQTSRILENKVHALNKDGNIKLSMEQYANGVYFVKIPALKYDGKVVLIKE
jgi:hypothetical protein